jgi:4'-phosphopantetheinyl transferase
MGRGVSVWLIDLTPVAADQTRLLAWLSPEERARADRFLRVPDRERFIGSHAALRLILAQASGLAPQALIFEQDAGGKPVLTPSQRADFHFNLSHSGSQALIGVSTVAPIGVDVEAIRPIGDPLAIARAHFHPDEIAGLMRASGNQLTTAFFRYWTRKEAVVKALGMGLALPLDSFCVTEPSGDAIRWKGADPASQGWSLIDLDVGPGATAAVAIPLPGQACHRFRLPNRWPDLA